MNSLPRKKLVNNMVHEEGTVIKAYGGFYYVLSGGMEWECALRGRLRHEKKQVMVGDRVLFLPRDGKTGVIEEVLPRANALIRPPVANVDQALMVFALKEPEPNPGLIDRFLIIASVNGIEPILCFNKSDLDGDTRDELIARYINFYRVIATSTITGEGLEQLLETLQDRITVFAGPSGVGKSTIINALIPGVFLKTGMISDKTKRGKHTTRHVELINLPSGGLVADTPGFTSLELPDIKPEELAEHFPEIARLKGECYFSGCLHAQEPDCRVKQAVESGEIQSSRYQQYLEFLKILKERKIY
jgi:ribosome biogenesis GTPase